MKATVSRRLSCRSPGNRLGVRQIRIMQQHCFCFQVRHSSLSSFFCSSCARLFLGFLLSSTFWLSKSSTCLSLSLGLAHIHLSLHLCLTDLFWHHGKPYLAWIFPTSLCYRERLYVPPQWSIAAAADHSRDAIWAGFWGLFYRKFFWDFVGGTLRDPGGLQCVP